MTGTRHRSLAFTAHIERGERGAVKASKEVYCENATNGMPHSALAPALSSKCLLTSPSLLPLQTYNL